MSPEAITDLNGGFDPKSQNKRNIKVSFLNTLVEPVPSLEKGRIVSGRSSGIKFLPQHSDFEYLWII
jgi:hypothetical protein